RKGRRPGRRPLRTRSNRTDRTTGRRGSGGFPEGPRPRLGVRLLRSCPNSLGRPTRGDTYSWPERSVMADLQFGISVVPNWQGQDDLIREVKSADELGLDLVGIQDHPYQWRFHDTWTLISFLAGVTSQIRFFPDVVSL